MPDRFRGRCILYFDYANVHFVYDTHKGWTWQMDRHTKIKIVNDDGKNYANILIPYYESKNNEEDVYTGQRLHI